MKTIDAVIPVLVDDEDFELVAHIGWYINEHGYARGHDPERNRLVYMHRMIMGAEDDQIIDHINRKTWDNRRSNLRISSRTENALNSTAEKRKRTSRPAVGPQSKFKGVAWAKDRMAWLSTFRGKHLGLFVDEVSAAIAYNDAVQRSGIAGAVLNDIGDLGAANACERYEGASKFRGVTWNTQQEKWAASVSYKKERVHAGFWGNEVQAALARDSVVRELEWDLPLNFPNAIPAVPPRVFRSLIKRGLIKCRA